MFIMEADLSHAAMESNEDCTKWDVSPLLSLSLKLPDAVHRRNYLCKLTFPLLAPPMSAPLTDDAHEQSRRSHTRERSMLTVVSRKHQNEPMGVGTHGSCTVIGLNLQGRETHGSKTELVGLSKLCWTLSPSIETHRSELQEHIHVIGSFKYFLLSLVNSQAPVIGVFKKRLQIVVIYSQHQLYIEIISLWQHFKPDKY